MAVRWNDIRGHMVKPFVYGLVDPVDVGHIRYVGMAPNTVTDPPTLAQLRQMPGEPEYWH